MDRSSKLISSRTVGLRTASLVSLVLACTTWAFGQCPPRPRIPDPPGWAIDTVGTNRIFGYQLSEDGKWFAFNSAGGIGLMNVHTGERKQLVPCIEVSADAFAFAPDSSLMAFGTGNGIIYLFEIPSGALKAQLQDDDWVQHLKFAPSGLLLATRTDGISIWDTISSRRVGTFSGGTCADGGPCVWQYFDEAELSPDGKLLATSGRENSGIVVRDMEGKVALWIKDPKELGPYLFLPGSPDTLLVSLASEIDFWDVASRRIVRRISHQGLLGWHSVVPGSSTIVVEEIRSGETEDVQQIDIISGKVLNKWHSTHLLSWISAEGVWATTYDREAIYMPTQRVAGKLEYIPSTPGSISWNVDYGYAAGRVVSKEPPTYLVIILFLILGVLGFLLCRVSKITLLAYSASAITLNIWWFRELWWPLHGPPIGRALGPVAVALTLLSIAVAYLLPTTPIWVSLRRKASPTRGLAFLWAIPLVAACLAGLLVSVSITQSKVEKERYQVEGDIRAGGELRGSGLVAWYERNLPYEAASAIYGPSFLVSSRLQEHGERVVLAATVAAAFAFWLLIAAVLFLPHRGKRLRRILLASALALVVVGSAMMLLSLYTFNPICRAYTPMTLLLHRLLWACCIGGVAIWALLAVRREIRSREIPVV
jgi:hypothetical protein